MLAKVLLSLGAVATAATLPTQDLFPSGTIDINRTPPQPQETICGDIINNSDLNGDANIFYASDVIQCLTSVPFNPAVALRFINNVNNTFQYHASTAFVKNPPAGYQQPPFDFFGALNDIVRKVQANYYNNEYAFELDVQTAVLGLHDGHAYITGGILSIFQFLAPYRFVSLSKDGKQLPQIYVYDDVINQIEFNGPTAVAVTQIDGRPAADYLTAFAKDESFGYVEPNADWNQMFYSPAQYLFGSNILSESAPFYAGNNLSITYANGTTQSDSWYALYLSPVFTGPLTTGGDVYNFFVLGLPPANFDDSYSAYLNSTDPSTIPVLSVGDAYSEGISQTSWNDNETAYPANPITVQADLGLFSSGIITGYYLPDVKAAVISIPSFAESGDGIDTFVQAVVDFIGNATARNASKIIFDLQQNKGGLVELAFETFFQFFPTQTPFAGSHMRDHEEANVLGTALTGYYNTILDNITPEEVEEFVGNEWVVTDRINAATGQNFTSWAQYYGPIPANSDQFSLIQEYDLNNPIFSYVGQGVPDDTSNATIATANWSGEDILIFTDGICGSTCSLFLNMMQQQGAKSVVVGGRPTTGPMQAASGSRAAAQYTNDQLYSDYFDASNVSTTAADALPEPYPDSGFGVVYSGFSIRDQVQPNATTPDQVRYIPADCRIYWSFANIDSLQQLWTDAYNAAFGNGALCVAGSNNATAPTTHYAQVTGSSPSVGHYITLGIILADGDNDNATVNSLEGWGLQQVFDDNKRPLFKICQSGGSATQCGAGLQCFGAEFACRPNKPGHEDFSICSRSCSVDADCGGTSQCQQTAHAATKGNGVSVSGRTISVGHCVPSWNSQSRTQCSRLNTNTLPGLIGST